MSRLLHPISLLLLAILLGSFLRLYQIDAVPPGLSHDEAYNGLDALRVLEGQRPIFFEANNGREPLFIYLVAGSIALLGRTPQAIRIVAVLLGVATILSTYFLMKALFDRRIALLTTILLSITYWHLSLSRLGFRAIALPLFATLTILLLWRGLVRGERWSLALSGLFLGASLYTYSSARFFPLVVLLLLVAWALARRPPLTRFLQSAALLGISAAIVFAPLGYYFATHFPEFTERAGQVSVFNPEVNLGDPAGYLLRNVVKTLGMFSLEGDTWLRHNLPGRPVFDPFFSLLALGGLLLAIRRWREPRYALLLLWPPIMMLPGILSEQAPHFLRTVGVLPAVLVFPALGLDAVWGGFSGRWNRRMAQAAIILLLAFEAGQTYRDYFILWPEQPDLGVEFFDTARVELAGQINGWLAEGSEMIYLSSSLKHPTTQYLVKPSERVAFFSPEAPPLPVSRAYYVMSSYELDSFVARRRLLGEAALHFAIEAQPGRVSVRLQSEPWSLTLTRPLSLRFGERIGLLGYSLEGKNQGNFPGRLRSGESLTLTLHWRALSPMPENYTVFLHLYDAEGHLRAQEDGQPAHGLFPTSRWRVGDAIEDRHSLALPLDLPPGEYSLRVGLYLLETMQRLPLASDGREGEGDSALLAKILIE